jgi:hypothetical protein
MLVEENKIDHHHNAYISAGKKAKREVKWNQDLEILGKEDEERQVEAHKRAWHTQLEIYDGKSKMELAKKAIETEWECVQYQCKAARKHYIGCRKVVKRNAGRAKNLEDKYI